VVVALGASLSISIAGVAAAEFGARIAACALALIAICGLLLLWLCMPETRPPAAPQLS